MSDIIVPSLAFNDFLYTSVIADGDEMPLSVVSASARLDLDPWGEAAALRWMIGDASQNVGEPGLTVELGTRTVVA